MPTPIRRPIHRFGNVLTPFLLPMREGRGYGRWAERLTENQQGYKSTL